MNLFVSDFCVSWIFKDSAMRQRPGTVVEVGRKEIVFFICKES